MNEFFKALTYVNENFYEPNHLTIKTIQEEAQNSEYGAGIFQLNSKSVRFRVAKVTPNKKGQFVAFWEKDRDNKNQAFSYANATDLLVINTFASNNHFGQFIFPKDILLKHNILKTDTSKGKMAIRVYPSWDTLTSKQAIATQDWQLPYFINLNNANSFVERHELLYIGSRINCGFFSFCIEVLVICSRQELLYIAVLGQELLYSPVISRKYTIY